MAPPPVIRAEDRATSTKDQPPAELSRETVASAVRALDADSRAERAAAESFLLGAGPRILEWLPSADSRPLGHPLIVIIARLEREQIEAAARPIQLPWPAGETVGEWLTRVERTGLSIVVDPAATSKTPPPETAPPKQPEWLKQPLPEGPVSVDLWDGLVRIERAFHGRFLSSDSPHTLHWTADAAPEAARTTVAIPSGPFLARISSRGVRTIPGGTDVRAIARLGVSIQTQPGLRGLISFSAVDEIALTQSDGTRLRPHVPGVKTELFWERGDESPPVLFDVDWTTGLPGPVRINGAVNVLVSAAPVRSEFPRVARSTPTSARPIIRKRAGRTAALEKVSVHPAMGNTPAAIDVRLLLTVPEAARWLESHQWGALPWVARLERTNDSGGVDTVEAQRRGDWDVRYDGVVLVDQRFEKIPEPLADWSLIIELPGLLEKRRVEFAGEFDIVPK